MKEYWNYFWWVGILWTILFVLILWLVRKRKPPGCECRFELMEHPDDHERSCPLYESYEKKPWNTHPDQLPTVPVRREKPPQPLSLLDSLPAGNVRNYCCSECAHILWTPGSHAEGCKNSMVHVDKEGWWFYDEIWVDRYGPFPTQGDCLSALTQYINEMISDPYA